MTTVNVHVRSKERRARLVEIERELALLKKKKRALDRSRESEASEAPFLDAGPADRTVLPGPVDAGERAPAGGGPARGGDPAGVEEAIPDEQRERFASYFMSGNLGRSGAQLRKERRAQRNKAILMAILAGVLLIVVARFLVK